MEETPSCFDCSDTTWCEHRVTCALRHGLARLNSFFGLFLEKPAKDSSNDSHFKVSDNDVR